MGGRRKINGGVRKTHRMVVRCCQSIIKSYHEQHEDTKLGCSDTAGCSECKGTITTELKMRTYKVVTFFISSHKSCQIIMFK